LLKTRESGGATRRVAGPSAALRFAKDDRFCANTDKDGATLRLLTMTDLLREKKN
jgi:hypothetical protein